MDASVRQLLLYAGTVEEGNQLTFLIFLYRL